MLDFLRRLFRPRIQPMNHIFISAKNILSNYKYLQSLQPQAHIFPVLKSNAYGHGLKQMLHILRDVQTPYIVVDSYPEYVIVRKHSKHNILLLGETLPHNYKYFDRKRTTFVVYNIPTLKAIAKRKKSTKIHLFINTGMSREGLDPYQIDRFLEVLVQYPHITLEGVLSHLHSADDFGSQSIQQQIDLFKKVYYHILDAGITPTYRYIGNSAGLFKIQDEFFNAYRPGIALYGYNPLTADDEFYDKGKKLKPALSVTSTVVALQQLAPGQGVSYNYHRKADKATTVAVVPFGYAEGLPRIASGKLFAKRKNKYIPQVGTITMNLSILDIGDRNVDIGDTIEMLSAEPEAKNSLYQLAQSSQTIVYECLTNLDGKIRRRVV